MLTEDPCTPEFPKHCSPWHTHSTSGKDLLWAVKKSAQTPLSVFLEGESGTGKEILASLLHGWSDRAEGPFVPINCGAFASGLAESELFGHVKGAFTGADRARSGALMQAHGGTLFLDEVGDLPMELQVKILRFLENGEIRPVGSDQTHRVKVRIVCATHRCLKKLIQEGKFRLDLYYRLASVSIQIPPLRDRIEDIALLARIFAMELGRTLSGEALNRLSAHSWPGNVRELRHAIERAAGIAGPFHTLLGGNDFEFLISNQSIRNSPDLILPPSILTIKEMERVMLIRSLKLTHGNREKAAKILGVARSTLFEMLKRHRIRGQSAIAIETSRLRVQFDQAS